MTLGRMLVLAILIWISVYTGSFGIWTWKRKNKLGAVMVFILAVITVALPVYIVYTRG